jgi:DNA topoisomerase-3
MVKTLLREKKIGPVAGFADEEGRPFPALLRLIETDKQWQVVVEPARESTEKTKPSDTLGICPVCGGDVKDGPKAYGCANWKDKDGGCKFTVWKTIAQKVIEPSIVSTLLETGISEKIEGFVSKKGSPFAAKLKLEYAEPGVLKVGFDFS